MGEAVKAYEGENGAVIYVNANRSKEAWSGGSRAWRNNNPGNVRYVAANQWQGQIGSAGGFCVFAGREWGERAVMMLLRTYARRNWTLGKALAAYAPASENDTAAYVRAVQNYAEIGAAVRLEVLVEGELVTIAHGIYQQEGWKVGTVRKV